LVGKLFENKNKKLLEEEKSKIANMVHVYTYKG
jgi:hypothetical protein